jgi:esterase/lipase
MSKNAIILPGMGADPRMYSAPCYEKLKNVTFAPWPRYRGEDSLKAVAESVIRANKIDQNSVIGGTSLGGMVAVEIAKIVGLPKVILISSATHPSSVNPVLKKLRFFAKITPIHLIQRLAGKANIREKNLVFSMFESADPEFIRTMSTALFNWRGIADYPGSVFRIHGSNDRMIFPPTQKVHIIEGGGHLISMTHADQVARFIYDHVGSAGNFEK